MLVKADFGLFFNNHTGFEVVDKGCCGVGRNNGQITCLPLQQPCENREKYLFWDAFHPTELANILLAKATYSSQSYTYPINIQQLAMLWKKFSLICLFVCVVFIIVDWSCYSWSCVVVCMWCSCSNHLISIV